jgi:hypothetical protein
MTLAVGRQYHFAGTICTGTSNRMLTNPQWSFFAINLNDHLIAGNRNQSDTIDSLPDGNSPWLASIDHQHRLAAHDAGKAYIERRGDAGQKAKTTQQGNMEGISTYPIDQHAPSCHLSSLPY